jgi:hypothetical protein
MGRQYWNALFTRCSRQDYLTLVCISTICVALVFALIGWALDLAWAWEIFGVITMATGVAVMASALLER